MANNKIKRIKLSELGYGFIEKKYIPEGQDEYYLRNQQNRSGIAYQPLTAEEIETLVRNRNTSDNWDNILVAEGFNPDLVRNCKFFGLVRIGRLDNICLQFNELVSPVGLYDSTVISCDFGHNIVVNNVHYLSHYILENEVMLINVDEIITTDYSKFGNGIVKEGEPESVRIWMEVCNENGGRKILPFNSMLTGDAWLWSRYRDDAALQEKFKIFTEQEFKIQRGYYGKIGSRTVIKNSGIIKDAWIGQDAYIKGANKLKNITINSGAEGATQIGEGCELVNGIVGFGCRVFYGVKAVRFVMASHSQLKYGARLINSYLGNNATISCCEVLNSLIFPAHEQHHNNSFLIAALVMGQSNIPAGATIGSNHNSRSADGEIVAERGFWPALCVSLKHNCRFPTFTMIAKGSYAYELNVPIPFSLISLNEKTDEVEIMVGYWFLYNMYALARNSWKYGKRDERHDKLQNMEYDYLAPDSANEIMQSLAILEDATGKAYSKAFPTEKIKSFKHKGKELLNSKDPIVETLKIVLDNAENSKRDVVLTKVAKGYAIFKQMIEYYSLTQILTPHLFQKEKIKDTVALLRQKQKRDDWLNVGGQLIPEKAILKLRKDIVKGKIKSWDQVHAFYQNQGREYAQLKRRHAIGCWQELSYDSDRPVTAGSVKDYARQWLQYKEWNYNEIYKTRQKDYTSPFRKMMYDSEAEMDIVLGALDDNSFIQYQKKELDNVRKLIGQ